MSSVAKKPLGVRCICPTCDFKWSRPTSENGKPCPKCQTPFNDSQVRRPAAASGAVAKKPAIPRANAAPSAPRSPQPAPTSPQPEVKAPVSPQPVARSASPKRAAAGSASPKKDIFSRLTDTSTYTGAHKARFNADGTGRGLAGRDSVTKGHGTAAGSITGGVHSGIGAKKASIRSTGKISCDTCGYSWNRPASESGRPCPKCQNPV